MNIRWAVIHARPPRSPGLWLFAAFFGCLLAPAPASAQPSSPFAQIDAANTTTGYLARLLINETPFPGERGYLSEANTRAAMLQILWVLYGRLQLIPPGYRQQQIAGVQTTDIRIVITGAPGKPQCEGFSCNAAGQFVTAPRVEERLTYLLKIANSGSQPGRFAGLLNYGQGLARAYVTSGITGADRYAALQSIGPVPVTGHAYSWMTDLDCYHPGGNFVTIPDVNDGALGGNRFFTLKKNPK